MTINITPATIIESTLLYGIVHAIWLGIRLLGKAAQKELRKEMRRERNRIIHRHVKTGHEGRLKKCSDQDCASLRNLAPAPVPALEVPQELATADLP